MTRGTGGAKPPCKIFGLHWKNVLDTVYNYWTYFKKFARLSENSSLALVSQVGYRPGHD